MAACIVDFVLHIRDYILMRANKTNASECSGHVGVNISSNLFDFDFFVRWFYQTFQRIAPQYNKKEKK